MSALKASITGQGSFNFQKMKPIKIISKVRLRKIFKVIHLVCSLIFLQMQIIKSVLTNVYYKYFNILTYNLHLNLYRIRLVTSNIKTAHVCKTHILIQLGTHISFSDF